MYVHLLQQEKRHHGKMPLHNLLKRGSDFGPIEVYISETVQDRRYISINH